MIEVLVTGANGQLGRCIQDIECDYPNINFTFKNSSELDITNSKIVNSFFELEEYDYCINCAAYTAVDKAEIDEERANLVNGEAVKFLAETCKEYNTILIHISTDFVFDGKKRIPYTETDVPDPINTYGKSKLKGEKYIREILERYFVVRTSWLYSEHGHNFVKTMLILAHEKNEIRVVGDQIGSPTYAKDLAKFLIYLIKYRNDRYGIYHFSNDGKVSWHDFAIEVFKLSSKSVKVTEVKTDEYPTNAVRPRYSVLSNEKIIGVNKALIKPFKISLKECLNAFVSNG